MKLELDTDALTDTEGDGSRLLVPVEILGVRHHLTLIRVFDDTDGTQRGTTPENEDDLEALQGLYPNRYGTVEVPGFAGQYVCYLHPYGD